MSLAEIGESNGRKILKIVNPATLAPVGEVPLASAEEVAAAVVRARAAQPAWGRTPARERCALVERAKRLLVERMDELAEVIHAETGKPRREALYVDLGPALDAFDLYARIAPALLDEQRIGTRAHWRVSDVRIEHQPAGVVGIIAPWNYPLGIPMGQVAPALCAGNAVVVKPSEHTPLTMLAAQKLFSDAGLPPGILEVVTGDGSTGAALTEQKLDRLVFTGSVATGRKVAATCATRLIPTILELGGSDPAIVLADADLELAAEGILWGRFVNGGQTCCAVKRCFVHRAVVDRFVERIAEKAKRLRVGPDLAHDVDMGPMISEAQRQQLEAQLADAVARGATVVTGGRRLDLPGYFFEPTIVTGAPREARVLVEETFGPLLPIVAVEDDEAAVARANDSSYGLLASVWSRDLARARELARRIDAGTVGINNCLWTWGVTETFWGGVKDSGLGHTHGPEGLLSLCNPKQIARNTLMPSRMPWWYPLVGGPKGYAHTRHALQGLFGGGLGRLLRGAAGLARERLTGRP